MGLTASTSLNKLSENDLVRRFVGKEPVGEDASFWETLLTFSFDLPKSTKDCSVFYKAIAPLLETFAKNNLKTGNLHVLMEVCLAKATPLRDESKCESNIATLRVRNALFILRCCALYLIQNHSEMCFVEHLLPAKHSSTATDPARQPPGPPSPGGSQVTGAATPSSVSTDDQSKGPVRKLILGTIALLTEIPLLPFTYDVHLEAVHLMLVLLSAQLCVQETQSVAMVEQLMSIPGELACCLVQTVVQHFVSQPAPPPDYLRSQSSGLVSSITSGLLYLVLPNRTSSSSEESSPLARASLLLLLTLVHQHARGANPFREALHRFCEEREAKENVSFHFSFEKLYLALCRELKNEHTTLLVYQLLQGNTRFANYIFSRTDIDVLLVPLLHQLCEPQDQPTHHSYMLLIILLILSQDECFNQAIHETVVKNITWCGERTLSAVSLGSLSVIVIIKAIHRNIQHLRDKFLHTNCLATLANMSSHFHSLNLLASEKLINLLKVLSKKYFRLNKMGSVGGATPEDDEKSMDKAADIQSLQEILQMLLEIINSCLTHTLHNNPHLVYSLLYQREIFTPLGSIPGFADLVQNIQTVVEYFSTSVEKDGTPPYSASYVLETIEKACLTWPKTRLRSFPELKFRYVEESQPEEFFIPYVWTLVHKHSSSVVVDTAKVTAATTPMPSTPSN